METYERKLVDYLSEFVRIPSRSSATGGDEGAVQQRVAEYMRQLGARVQTFEATALPGFPNHPLCHGPSRNYWHRPVVLGEVGPQDAEALLILAHSDTVQIFQPEQWTVNPFCGELRDGALYGLGSSDDKWGLATMLVLIEAIQNSAEPLKKKLIFASTIDEENGVGNGTLLLHLADIKAKSAFYLDGGGMDICIGCLGGSNLYLRPERLRSREELAVDLSLLSQACEAYSERRRRLFDRPFFDQNLMRDRSVLVNLRTDQTGAFFLIAFYTLAGEDPAAFCQDLESVVNHALGSSASAYRQSYRRPWFEPALVPPETPLVQQLAASVRKVLDCEPKITTISKQDSFVLTNHAGIPTVSFGCSRHQLGLGAPHNPDERLEVSDLWNGFQIAHATVSAWLDSDS